ncbi:Hemerythrin HHE cation binding domain-containing protein [Thalassobacillus cyri]|uniref:Hemerythrin HHE cation binding domain-containing protein n=1 Tax=Thalassobacillus cyri TaxID=571932 RepID=A0A1H4G8S9_9BACI|nr:hemerythrin domain-containing protein [Thalassobacillus cyri]SEB06026.1 Hemerythrin HHE cation binding domain-containing protein [Thalassobacillus cyri]
MLRGYRHIRMQVELFLKDHQSLREEMGIIDGWLTDIEQMGRLSDEELKRLVVPVKHFYEQLSAHLTLEEQELFPLLTKEIEEKGYLYFTFELEHQQMKQYIKQFLYMVERFRDRTVGIEKGNSILITLRFALEAVAAHFIREEEILFPEILKLTGKTV